MRFSLVAILILLSTTGCLDTDGEIQGESTNGSTSTAAGERYLQVEQGMT